MKSYLFFFLVLLGSYVHADVLPGSVNAKADVVAGDSPSGTISGRLIGSDLSKMYDGATTGAWNGLTFYIRWPYLMNTMRWGKSTASGYPVSGLVLQTAPSSSPTAFSDLRNGFVKHSHHDGYDNEDADVTITISAEGVDYYLNDDGRITHHFFTWVK